MAVNVFLKAILDAVLFKLQLFQHYFEMTSHFWQIYLKCTAVQGILIPPRAKGDLCMFREIRISLCSQALWISNRSLSPMACLSLHLNNIQHKAEIWKLCLPVVPAGRVVQNKTVQKPQHLMLIWTLIFSVLQKRFFSSIKATV